MLFFNHIRNYASRWAIRSCGKHSWQDYSTLDKAIFDAKRLSTQPYSNTIIEHFKNYANSRRLLIADINDQKDLDLVAHLANHHRDVHIVVAPRKISEERLNNIRMCFNGNSLLYSECNEATDFKDTQILVIDYLGDLPLIYRYGTWAYVGCGLAEIIIPISYGLPVAYGNHHTCQYSITQQLIEHKIFSIVRTKKDISQWFENLCDNDSLLEQISNRAKSLVANHTTDE